MRSKIVEIFVDAQLDCDAPDQQGPRFRHAAKVPFKISVFRIRSYSLNPDLAKNLNLDSEYHWIRIRILKIVNNIKLFDFLIKIIRLKDVPYVVKDRKC